MSRDPAEDGIETEVTSGGVTVNGVENSRPGIVTCPVVGTSPVMKRVSVAPP